MTIEKEEKPNEVTKRMANEVAQSFMDRGDLGVAIEVHKNGSLVVVREGQNEGEVKRTIITADSHQ